MLSSPFATQPGAGQTRSALGASETVLEGLAAGGPPSPNAAPPTCGWSFTPTREPGAPVKAAGIRAGTRLASWLPTEARVKRTKRGLVSASAVYLTSTPLGLRLGVGLGERAQLRECALQQARYLHLRYAQPGTDLALRQFLDKSHMEDPPLGRRQ